MTTTMYMVRHAESPFAFGEERTRGLSEEGWEEARRVGRFFQDIDVDFVASSSYTRAKQTVQFVAESKGLPIAEYEELIERPIKGLDYQATWDTLYQAIRQSFADKDFALEGGESTRAAQQRAIPVIERLLNEQECRTFVIGTHGNIMTIIMNYYDEQYGFEFWDQTTKPDIYKLTFEGQRLVRVERVWK
ncbi:histidine phosphatase family protein [Paenibacillus whitsoniae]|uniref:Histidine phosphatase family protein n=1 Tax=Paenibacillus whitsoniae TaxID=2496558 RepID=A0A430JKH6_9BACL|nr:histidine phosphatase family protein [Paenibacillus whitsoniae]RTE11557.1 histidine phosphatase family protein [Paenibacillus whitsoniae]